MAVLDGELEWLQLATDARLDLYPIRRLRYLHWVNASQPGVVVGDQVERLAGLGIECLEVGWNMPNVRSVCALLQRVRVRELAVDLFNLRDLLHHAGHDALRRYLGFVRHLVVSRDVTNFRAEWQFIASLPGLKVLELQCPFMVQEPDDQMRGCFRKVKRLYFNDGSLHESLVAEFRYKLPTVMLTQPLNDFAVECPVADHVRCYYDMAFDDFLEICAMPNIKRIEIQGEIAMTEAEMAKMVDVLSCLPLEVIILTKVSFSAVDVARIFRFQGGRLRRFQMHMSSGMDSTRETRNILALLECAMRWTPNILSLRGSPLLGRRRFEDPVLSLAITMLRSKVHLRCPTLNLEAWEEVGLFGLI